MTLFTFHTFRADGAPVAMDTVDLASEQAAHAYAQRVLDAHLSAQSVSICLDDREIANVARSAEA